MCRRVLAVEFSSTMMPRCACGKACQAALCTAASHSSAPHLQLSGQSRRQFHGSKETRAGELTMSGSSTSAASVEAMRAWRREAWGATGRRARVSGRAAAILRESIWTGVSGSGRGSGGVRTVAAGAQWGGLQADGLVVVTAGAGGGGACPGAGLTKAIMSALICAGACLCRPSSRSRAFFASRARARSAI